MLELILKAIDRLIDLLEGTRRPTGRFSQTTLSRSTLISRRSTRRPWKGHDRLFLRTTATAVEVRYLVDEPVRRSWEFRFKPELPPEELCDWLASLR